MDELWQPRQPDANFCVHFRAHAGRLGVELAIILHEGDFVGKNGVTPLANVLLRPRTLQHLQKQECSLQVCLCA